jgi:Protein of unknown function (DUF3168)
MDIDAGITALLAGDSGVKSKLKTGGAESIFDGVVPEDVAQYPCLAYQFVGGSNDPGLTAAGPRRSRLQVDCWGTTKAQSIALANAVAHLLDGFSGALTDGTNVMSCWIINPPGVDLFSAESRFRRRMLEFYLLHNFTP